MNENNSSRNRIILIAALAVIGLCLVAAVAAVIGGAAGYMLAQRQQGVVMQTPRTADDSQQPNGQMPMMPGMPNGQMPMMPGMPDDQMPMMPGMMNMNGALIHAVTADGPADKAGLKVGDLITAVGDKPLDQNLTLAAALAAYKPGDSVKLTFRRNADEQTVTVTLGQHPDDATKPYLGITFVTMPMRQSPGQ